MLVRGVDTPFGPFYYNKERYEAMEKTLCEEDLERRSPEKIGLEKGCDNMKQVALAVAEIADILRQCEDKAEARRIIVAAGLTSGVYDVTDDSRIVELPRKT